MQITNQHVDRFNRITDWKALGCTWAQIGGYLGITGPSAKSWYKDWSHTMKLHNLHTEKSMAKTSRGLAAEIKRDMRERNMPPGRGARWDSDLRDRIVKFTLASGLPVNRTASELGIDDATLSGWIRHTKMNDKKIMVPEATAEAAKPKKSVEALFTAETATLVADSGFRIEGLSVKSVVQVLKELQS